jgi:serine/threonine-protein kinase
MFAGETVQHVLAAVLTSEPDWSVLPADTPAAVRRLLRWCLERDRKRRLDSASAARLEIEDALASAAAPTSAAAAARPRRMAAVAVTAALAGGAVVALAAWAWVRPTVQNPRPPSRFAITPPPERPPWTGPFDRSIVVSPDGRHVVYTTALAAATGGMLMMRSIDRLEITPLAGIDAARAPFFSADSRWVGFFRNTDLMKAPVDGGPALSICRFQGAPRGASWGDDGAVVFATSDPTTGLWRVPSGGGEPTVLTTPAEGEGDHLFPTVLPAGRGVLFTIAAQDQSDASIAILDAATNERRILVRGGSQAEYVESGHLVYAAAGTLRAVRFDLGTLRVISDPIPVLDHVRMASTGAANYGVSRSGTLAYIPGGPGLEPRRSLMWVDRAGREEPVDAPLRAYTIPRLSPDGTRAALDIRDEESDIWILDLARQSGLRKLTSGASSDTNPVWSVDGTQIVFTSSRSGPPRLYRQPADGSGAAELLSWEGEEAQRRRIVGSVYATSMTPDGKAIVGHGDGPMSFDVLLFPFQNPELLTAVTAATGRVRPLVRTNAIEHNAELSPDGRYLAYQTNESGRFEIAVRPFPDVDRAMWTISSDGGTRPLWARNGKELFYRDESAALVAVPVGTAGRTLDWGAPVRLFDSKDASSQPDRNYDVTPDGRRFLMIKEDASRQPDPIVVVLDWSEELKRLVPVN